MGRAKGPAKHAGPTARLMATGMLIKGYVRRWDRRAPPPGELNAWDAGADSAHVTCENGARDTLLAAQKVNSVNEGEGGFDTDQYFFPPDPLQGHARGHGFPTRELRA